MLLSIFSMIKVSDILNMGLTDIHSQSFGDHWALEKTIRLMEKVNKSPKQECKDQVKKSFAFCY